MRKPRQEASPQVLRCAIYARKSTTAGLEQSFNSLDSQREVCLAYIRQKPSWTALPTKYEDGGFTGANLERPAFARLMADIAAKRIDVVVVYKLDRLSRSLADFVRCIDTFAAAGVSFVSVTESFSTADAMGRLTMNLLASFAEFERGMVSERTRDKIHASRRKGLWTGGSVPIGYVTRNKKLVMDAAHAETVRRAFALFRQHRSISQVAHLLAADGRSPPASRGKPRSSWTVARLAALLRNPVYVGRIRCGNEWVIGEHEPIIDPDAFRDVQAVLAGRPVGLRSTVAERNDAYVLRGLIRCGTCDGAMIPSTTKSRGRAHRYYRCSTRIKTSGRECMGRQVPAAETERLVVEQLQTAFDSAQMREQIYMALRAALSTRQRTAESTHASLAQRLATTATRSNELAVQADGGSAEALKTLRSRLRADAEQVDALKKRLAEAKHELTSVAAAAKDIDWILAGLRNFPKVWEHMTLENRSRFLGALVQRVIVRPDEHQLEVVLDNPAQSTGLLAPGQRPRRST